MADRRMPGAVFARTRVHLCFKVLFGVFVHVERGSTKTKRISGQCGALGQHLWSNCMYMCVLWSWCVVVDESLIELGRDRIQQDGNTNPRIPAMATQEDERAKLGSTKKEINNTRRVRTSRDVKSDWLVLGGKTGRLRILPVQWDCC